jgi:diguanylate cyclase (GGDEF)-like protein
MKKVIPFSTRSEASQSADPRQAVAAQVAGTGTNSAPLPGDRGVEQQLLLLQRLVGCLDRAELLQRFYRWADDLGLADSVCFSGQDQAALTLGTRRHHSAQYSLCLDGRTLGTLTLSRRERFSESELLTLEQCLGAFSRCLLSALDYESLSDLVTQDSLTGLGNRASLQEWLSRELARSRRHRSPLAVMMIDVDRFKLFNDALGHLGGDHILRTVAGVFKRCTRGSDLVFRFGGDEFTILLPHTDLQGAREAAQQIRENLAQVNREGFGLGDCGLTIRPDVSIGLTAAQADDDEESLMQRADTHLYHAKAQGRGQICDAV